MRMRLTLMHAMPRKQPYETPSPVVKVKDIRWIFRPAGQITAVRFGTESEPVDLPVDGEIVLNQPDELHYTIERPGQKPIEGTRSPGWLAVNADGKWTMLGVRHFWQNCPKQLFVSKDGFGVRLWAGKEPFEWEGGLAKTHEVILEISPDKPDTMHLDPLRAVIPPAWVCGTKAAGALMPRTAESLETMPYWEARRQIDMQQFVNGMPFGFRDFGDGYMGGPYKGKNAYMDLEYDVPWNFLMQFLRTGDVWYLKQAEVMVRHQADIDTENAAGFQWKHSPQHTTTQAELGHVFIRGLLLHYLLTGESRSLETAEKIGNWIAGQLNRGQGLGNERQIGWSLYALSGLYEVTRNPEILAAATTACNRLIDGQSPTGKFKIRWDNRIAFFNGIAMNGMLTVQQLSGDAKLAEAIDRVANRTLGMYPEYACRTLNAFSWILGRKADGRYLDAMERSWISSMEFLHDRDSAAEETHAWMFPAFAARYGLFPVFDKPPTVLPEVGSWKAIRFVNPAIEAYLRVEIERVGADPADPRGAGRGQGGHRRSAGQARRGRIVRQRSPDVRGAVDCAAGAGGVSAAMRKPRCVCLAGPVGPALPPDGGRSEEYSVAESIAEGVRVFAAGRQGGQDPIRGDRRGISQGGAVRPAGQDRGDSTEVCGFRGCRSVRGTVDCAGLGRCQMVGRWNCTNSRSCRSKVLCRIGRAIGRICLFRNSRGVKNGKEKWGIECLEEWDDRIVIMILKTAIINAG